MRSSCVVLLLSFQAAAVNGQAFCTADAMLCPDGSSVGRDSNNNCEFFPCPVADPIFCTADAKLCPDGSSVGRDSNNNCEFFPCLGDVGSPCKGCAGCRALCGQCDDGVNNYGCCGNCVVALDADNKNKICSGYQTCPTCKNCDGVAVEASPSQCKQDPCSIENGGCGEGKCTANYCGGCNACCSMPELGDIGSECKCDGTLACKGPCGMCPDGINTFGCCGNCAVAGNADGSKFCSPVTECPVGCQEDAKVCNDGTVLVRDAKNNCEFPDCPCRQDRRVCRNGDVVVRDPKRNCRFPWCRIY